MCYGVRSLGKAVYITSILPLILLIIFLIRSLTLSGATMGLEFLFHADISQLNEQSTWIDAATEIIFGLGIGSGNLMTLSSYNQFQNNVIFDAFTVVLVAVIVRVLCAMVVFGFMGFFAYSLGVALDTGIVNESGTCLLFLLIPDVLRRIPASSAWCFLFFLLLFSMEFSNILPMVEKVLTGISDKWRPLSKHRFILVCVLSGIFFLVGILFCTSAGVHMLLSRQLHLHPYVSAVVICAMSSCAVFYSICRMWRDLQLMLGNRRICETILTYIIAIPAAALQWFLLPVSIIVYLAYNAMRHDRNFLSFLVDWSVYLGWVGLGLTLLPLIV